MILNSKTKYLNIIIFVKKYGAAAPQNHIKTTNSCGSRGNCNENYSDQILNTSNKLNTVEIFILPLILTQKINPIKYKKIV